MPPGVTKLNRLDARCPGLLKRVDAMFDAFATIKSVSAMIRAEYGEFICISAIRNYRYRIWRVRRDRKLQMDAERAAWEALVREGRS